MFKGFHSKDGFLLWRGCNERHLYSSGDSCEGQLCPSEGYGCGCHGKVSLGKHPSSLHFAEKMKMSRNGDSRQSASSDQIWQHICLLYIIHCLHLLLAWSQKRLSSHYSLGEQKQLLLSDVSICGPITSSRQDCTTWSGLWETHCKVRAFPQVWELFR